jgi:hypothetical protein
MNWIQMRDAEAYILAQALALNSPINIVPEKC